MGTIARAATAVATGGVSELARKKPFQPGGSNDPNALVKAVALGPTGSALEEAASGAASLGTKVPPAPTAAPAPSPATTAVQQASTDAAQRRSRARGFKSTILSQTMLNSNNPAMKETYGS